THYMTRLHSYPYRQSAVRITSMWALASALVFSAPAMAASTSSNQGESMSTENRVRLQTSSGDIVIELDAEKAPKTVENFLTYVQDGFYDGTIFHRVIKNLMLQGGCFAADLNQKNTRDPITNEADNGLKNNEYTLAMARTSDPHSATAQFFINVADNEFLNFTAPTSNGWGYAVFGKV